MGYGKTKLIWTDFNRQCPKCDFRIPKYRRFCPNCGRHVKRNNGKVWIS